MPATPYTPAAAPFEPLSPKQYALRGLLLAGMAAVFVTAMLTPAVDGIGGLPGHFLDKLRDNRPHAARRAPEREVTLTKAQQSLYRRKASFIAAREVGVHEWPSRDNRGGRITTYRRAVTGAGERNPARAVPWCADFASWVWNRAGVPIGFGGHGSDSVAVLAGWAQLTHRWHAARGSYHPVKGDLIVYSAYSHVGVVVKVGHGVIKTVEGNYSDKVARRTMSARQGNIKGYISPV